MKIRCISEIKINFRFFCISLDLQYLCKDEVTGSTEVEGMTPPISCIHPKQTTMSKIALIGAGNLATNIGKALVHAGHAIVQVYSRTLESATQLAHVTGGDAITDLRQLVNDADLYLISVKDSALSTLLPVLCKGREDRLFVHTAGSIPMDIFQPYARHYGVIYPMQTFSKQKEVNFREIPCFIEGSDESSLTLIKALCSTLSDRIIPLASEDRKYLHLAAVFACNFVNHCYALAADLVQCHHIPFDVMLPLIDETARKVHSLSPEEAQTGPAIRYDKNVILRQEALLGEDPLAQQIYSLMSESIHKKCNQ